MAARKKAKEEPPATDAQKVLHSLCAMILARLRLYHALRIAPTDGSLSQHLCCAPAGRPCEHAPRTETAKGDAEYDASGG
jgi:hypothetical protein